MSYQPVPIQTEAEARQQFLGGACDAYTTDASGLASVRATYENPDNYIILPEIISKEPLGPVVRHGDNQWADIVRWTFYALVAAEEYGVTKANIDEMKRPRENPEIRRLLGVEGDLGMMFGLEADWAANAIEANGNYGEIFAANIGEGTPVEHRPRPERPVDRRRPAVRPAVPLIRPEGRRDPRRALAVRDGGFADPGGCRMTAIDAQAEPFPPGNAALRHAIPIR